MGGTTSKQPLRKFSGGLRKMATHDVTRALDIEQVKRGWYETRECDYWIPEADVEGSVPAELYGTLLRNGPGLLEVYGTKLRHRE